MKKLVFCNYTQMLSVPKTGVGVYEENLLKQLDHLCYPYEWIGPDPSVQGPMYRWLKKHRIRNHIKGLKLLYKWIPIEFQYGFNKIYVCDTIIPVSFPYTTVIAIVQDVMLLQFPEFYSNKRKEGLTAFFKRLKKADYIITSSHATKHLVIKYFSFAPNKIFVTPYGVDHLESGNKSTCFIPKTSIDISKKYVFYIGDMRGNKNLLKAIKGFEKYIRDTGDDLYFYIAGRKNFEYLILKKYVEEHSLDGNVIFLNYVTDHERLILYHNAFGFIFVSLAEGFGMPILEAMLAGIPVITSNCSSMKEIAKGAALLVNPLSEKAICDAINQLNDVHTRVRLINAGKKRANNYTWKASAKLFVKFIKEIAR